MGVSEKRQNFHFGVEYPFNSRTCMVISLYIQTSVGKNGHLQVVPVHGN